MELAEVLHLLARIKGGTFATLDSVTYPAKGIKKVTTGERVMLFTNQGGSAYEKMVKRKLAMAGKDPDNFVLSELPWGDRIPNTPIIYHRGRHYLQVIQLHPGISVYYMGRRVVPDPASLLKKRVSNQGLGEDSVIVETYAMKNITKIKMFGETVTAREQPREVLRPKYE